MPAVPGLKRIREDKFLTQKDVADRAHLARSTIAEIETAKRPARFSTINKLAAALDVSPNDLVTRGD